MTFEGERPGGITLRELLEEELGGLRTELREWEAAHMREHTLLAEAQRAQLTALDRRLEGMNALRQQIEQERSSYVTRALYDQYHAALTAHVEETRAALEARLSRLENDVTAMNTRFLTALAVLGVVVTGLQFALHVVGVR